MHIKPNEKSDLPVLQHLSMGFEYLRHGVPYQYMSDVLESKCFCGNLRKNSKNFTRYSQRLRDWLNSWSRIFCPGRSVLVPQSAVWGNEYAQFFELLEQPEAALSYAVHYSAASPYEPYKRAIFHSVLKTATDEGLLSFNPASKATSKYQANLKVSWTTNSWTYLILP